MLPAPGVAPARAYRTSKDFLEYFAEARANGVLVEPDAYEFLVEPDAYELRLGSSGAVLVAGRIRMTTSAGPDEVPAWFVYTFRDGLIASLENFLDRDLAYESAGLTASSPTSSLSF